MNQFIELSSGTVLPIDQHNTVSGYVTVPLSDMHCDFEQFLNLLSEGLTGTEILSDITYSIHHASSDNEICFAVSGDASLIIESEELDMISEEDIKKRDDVILLVDGSVWPVDDNGVSRPIFHYNLESMETQKHLELGLCASHELNVISNKILIQHDLPDQYTVQLEVQPHRKT